MFFARHLADPITEACRDSPVVLVNGARQTGKSTLVQSLFTGTDSPDYLTFDEITVLAAARASPQDFVDGLPRRVILDEVQRVPDLFIALKRAVDRDRMPGRFLLTGSANILTLPKLSESLAGRMEVHTLWPLSQGERQGRREAFIDRLFGTGALPKVEAEFGEPTLSDRLLVGGYPEPIQRQQPRRRTAWFRSYLTTLLQRDVAELSRIEGLNTLPDLLALLASRTGALLNIAELSRSLAVPESTLRRYLTLLEGVFLVAPVPAWSANVGKRLVKSPKLYLNDTGLLCHLLGLDADALARDRKQKGAILENFVAIELLKQRGWADTPTRLYHFRTSSGQEVDFVLEAANGRLVGLEVKSTSAVNASAFDGLKILAEAAGDRFHRGVVLYGGAHSIAFGPDLEAVPLQALWSL